jgi:hypothetical protein
MAKQYIRDAIDTRFTRTLAPSYRELRAQRVCRHPVYQLFMQLVAATFLVRYNSLCERKRMKTHHMHIYIHIHMSVFGYISDCLFVCWLTNKQNTTINNHQQTYKYQHRQDLHCIWEDPSCRSWSEAVYRINSDRVFDCGNFIPRFGGPDISYWV